VALGSDPAGVATQFVEAMRPIAGDNVDLPQVQANLAALGLAVHRTLAVQQEGTAFAVTYSDIQEDPDFWAWVRAMQKWVAASSTAFAAWTPTTPAEVALKAALVATAPPAAAPESVQGRLR
jgi:hypothetical protein